MHGGWKLIGKSASAGETRTLGATFAEQLKPGDIVLLSGDLGAGKTQFVQGIAAGLGVDELPVSPTFNIVLTYESGRLPLHHFDLYRLDTRAQLEDIGLPEYLEGGGVCCIEWAEKFPGLFGGCYEVRIEKESKDARAIRLRDRRDAAATSMLAKPAESTPTVGAPSAVVIEAAPVQAPSDAPGSADAAFAEDKADSGSSRDYVLAFDTANEVVSIGIGRLEGVPEGDSNGSPSWTEKRVRIVATREIAAHRASNTTLVPAIDELLAECGVSRGDLACVCVGRGPGSFTGVRIAMATAKGIASALGLGLIGVSTLDAIAWNAWAAGVRGEACVLADAMRKEVYPVRYDLDAIGAHRLTADCVVKANAARAIIARSSVRPLVQVPESIRDTLHHSTVKLLGDALVKYRDTYEPHGEILPRELWDSTGRGLLLALEAAWRAGEVDPRDPARHDPAFALPVYTRLSDAEENERARLARTDEKNLVTGVQDVDRGGADADGEARVTMHSQARLVALPDAQGVTYRPLDAARVEDVAALEAVAMGSDAWSTRLVADELGQRNRTWWIAEAAADRGESGPGGEGEAGGAPGESGVPGASGVPGVPGVPGASGSTGAARTLIGYAGGLVVDGDLQILKIAVSPDWRRCGVARELLYRVAEDARNLGASTCSLEVRASNAGAQAFYRTLGLRNVGVRPRYYSDREDASIMAGPLPGRMASHDVAGMTLQHLDTCGAHGAGDAGAYGAGNAGADAGSGKGGHAGSDAGAVPAAAPGASAVREGAQPSPSRASGAPEPLILAIESSCDETAAAIVDGKGVLRSDVVASQIDFHARFGGVVPEIASRKHIEAICGVCEEALDVAGTAWRDLDAIAVTRAPGLLGALVVGVAFAKGAAWALDVPLIGVNHLEGHLYANKIGLAPDEPAFEPPAVVSLVSGGNTMLVHMRGWGDYVVLGETIDDAAGEAFDKVAKALGLGYPGGPAISRAAEKGDAEAIAFPRAMLHSHDLRFSLSGLKTAVVNHINGERGAGHELNIPDIAASFQQAVVDVQVAKAATALDETGAPTFCLGGGVAANPVLRAAYEKMCREKGVRLIMPPLSSCGDNAGMIALVALDHFRAGRFLPLDADAAAHEPLGQQS